MSPAHSDYSPHYEYSRDLSITLEKSGQRHGRKTLSVASPADITGGLC